MLEITTIKKIDIEKMYQIYDNWPKIPKDTYLSDHKPIKFSGINHIIFSGMGGSDAIGDIFAGILSKSN